ncbi:MAG TPA: SIS domain-containing protein [Solirubrobacteraceae bacterium]|nr:SIS domain-containing protein [Solirubrobacteraceae bacterium]
MSAMRETMATQPEVLREILDDRRGLEAAAQRLGGRRVLVVGTGTSWHAANQGAWWLRMAGVDAWAVTGADAASSNPAPGSGDALLLLSHRGTKLFTSEVLEHARAAGVPTVVVSKRGNPDADLETVPEEVSAAFTASNLGALMRVAQLAEQLGASLGRLGDVPDAVARELEAGSVGVKPPARMLEFAGVGINAWTAAEGALKIRETALVATEGLACESILHGPAVALGADDSLICLDSGTGSDRLRQLADVARAQGAVVYEFSRPELGEALSVFPLTVIVQKIAAEGAEALGTNPDKFGRDLPGRDAAWSAIKL